jgi:toxin ParE1/3/4
MATLADFNEAACEEFDHAFEWYAERSHGAAIGFAAAVDEAIDRVLENPQRFAETYADCRYCLTKRYPFCIIYYVSPQGVHVVAVAHAKRSPDYWRNRL